MKLVAMIRNSVWTEEMKTGKAFVLRNGMFFFLVLVFAAGLKYHYSEAGSEDLVWILRPTAALVERISGIPFEQEALKGFVSYARRIVIAPACAGVNFLIVAFCMAAFSGLYHIAHQRLRCLWLAGSLAAAYGLTVFVNAVRIVLSIYSYDADIYSGWLTPERMHRLEGVVIYFFFLCLFYRIITAVCLLIGTAAKQNEASRAAAELAPWKPTVLVPFFWYALVTLALPALNGAFVRNQVRFSEHATMIISGCLAVGLVIFVVQAAWRQLKSGWSRR